MRKLKHNIRRRPRKQPMIRAITLALEALEPRLVLSAVGFGFEGTRRPSDLHDPHHGNREANRPAFAEPFHNKPGQDRFEFVNRFEVSSPVPPRGDHPRGGRPNEPVLANSLDHARHRPPFNARPAKPPVGPGRAEGESTRSTDDFENNSSNAPVDVSFATNPYAETTIPSATVIFISLTPTTAPTLGDDLSNIGQLTTRLTPPPPRPVSAESAVSQRSSSAATLPIEVQLASSAASRTPPIAPSIESSAIRFDSGGSSGADDVSAQTAGEATRIAEPGNFTFVSLATSDLASWSNVDGESLETVFDIVERLSESAPMVAAADGAVASFEDVAGDGFDRRSEESFWAGVSEGGFIEIDSDAADDSRERFEFTEEAEDAARLKRLPIRTPRDAFWFDFGDTRLDLILDSSAVEELAEEPTRSAADADEEAWLLEDGGMIALTSSQFTEQVVEAAIDDAEEVSATDATATDETATGESDIPMDAGIGVFQAIEVAAAPIDQQVGGPPVDGTAAPIEGEATAEADDVAPAEKQAAKASESGSSEPIRAAAMPLLLAVAGFVSRGQKNRRNVANRQTKA